MLRPQTSASRELLNLDGIWDFKVDFKDDRSVDVMMTLTTPNCPALGLNSMSTTAASSISEAVCLPFSITLAAVMYTLLLKSRELSNSMPVSTLLVGVMTSAVAFGFL